MYALVKDDIVISECEKQRVMFDLLVPNATDEELKELGIIPVQERIPTHNSLTEEIRQTHWIIENDIAFKCWEVFPKDPSLVRKQLEAQATVTFLDKIIKADDKAVSMLQGYLGSSIELVYWKCVDGFLELDKAAMTLLLGEILTKKAQLFEAEYEANM